MASITKYRSGWRAYVYVDDGRVAKTFRTKAEAMAWTKSVENGNAPGGTYTSSGATFRDLLEKYEKTETPKKRGSAEESRRIAALMKEPIASISIHALTSDVLQNWIDTKKNQISPQTGRKLKTSSVARYLTIIKAVFTYAVKKKLLKESPAADVHCPIEEEARERIATEEEMDLLKTAVQWSEDEPPVLASQRIIAAFIFACYTGMRIGEIERIERSWIQGSSIKIPKEITKTYHSRTIAIPNRAMNILNQVLSLDLEPAIFGLRVKQHDALFRKIRNAAGLCAVYDSNGHEVKQGLNFHDSRATFCTWAASPGSDGAPRLDVLALAKQTGHKNLKMLMRYYRKDPTELLSRLND